MNNNQAAIQRMTQILHQRNIERDFFENDDTVYNNLEALLIKCELRDVIDDIKKYSLTKVSRSAYFDDEINNITITYDTKYHFVYKKYRFNDGDKIWILRLIYEINDDNNSYALETIWCSYNKEMLVPIYINDFDKNSIIVENKIDLLAIKDLLNNLRYLNHSWFLNYIAKQSILKSKELFYRINLNIQVPPEPDDDITALDLFEL